MQCDSDIHDIDFGIGLHDGDIPAHVAADLEVTDRNTTIFCTDGAALF